MKNTHNDSIEKMLNPNWIINHTDTNQTGIRIFSVSHPDEHIPTTVYIAEPNPEIDVPSLMAYAGAKTSRSQTSFDEAFKEIHEAMIDNPDLASERLAKIFVGYGHASVADMAPLFLYFNKIPLHLAAEIFHNISVGAGQESSTRYIEFGDLGIDSPEILLDLEKSKNRKNIVKEWNEVLDISKQLYYKWWNLVQKRYQQIFPESSEKTLVSRSLDIARQWIPFGTKTSMGLLMSARDWVRLVKYLTESTDIRNRVLGLQITQALTLSETEAGKDISIKLGALLKHGEATWTTRDNLSDLKKYLEKSTDFTSVINRLEDSDCSQTFVKYIPTSQGLGLALQYILSLYPNTDEQSIVEWLSIQSDDIKEEIGKLILQNYTDHNQMGTMGDIRGNGIFSIKSSISYFRDLNRHKALGRYTNLFMGINPKELLNYGFNLNYQIFNTTGFEDLRSEWENDARSLYSHLYKLNELVDVQNDNRWILRVLPIGHNCQFHLSGPITQLNYLISLRCKRGSDFGYLNIVEHMLPICREDVFLKHMLDSNTPLDLQSSTEFNARS